MQIKSDEEKRDLISKVQKEINLGSTSREAFSKFQISHSQYYTWRKKLGAAKKPKRPTKGPRLVNIEIPEADNDFMVVLIGQRSHLSGALDKLTQMKGGR